MKFEELCRGCKSCTDRESKGSCLACNTPILSNTSKCPCIICLVKGMCVRSCEEYKVYANTVYDHYNAQTCKEIQERKRNETDRSV